MIAFAWLQSRTQIAIATVLAAALAVVAAITGVQLAHLYATLVAPCQANCGFAVTEFVSHDVFLNRFLNLFSRAFPALIGVFWGAPLLAREFETGTHRLAWTQGVTRTRWVLTKLAIGGLATALLSGALTWTITWWNSSLDQVNGSAFQNFDRRDIVPIGYSLFAFAVGALIGAMVRRTVPAMALTLVVFVLVRVVIGLWVTPHLMAPLHETLPMQNAGPTSTVQIGIAAGPAGGIPHLFVHGEGPAGSMTVSSQVVDTSGHVVSSDQLSAFFKENCPDVGTATSLAPPPNASGISAAPGSDAGRACLQQLEQSHQLLVAYQPASRYWPFQWLATGLYFVLALACAAVCFLWLRRRPS